MLASDIAILRCLQQVSGAAAIVTIPEAAWELSLGVYLIVSGIQDVVAAQRHLPYGTDPQPGSRYAVSPPAHTVSLAQRT